MTEIILRDAMPGDADRLTALIRALAAHDGSSADVNFNSDQLREALTGPAPRLRAILAVDGDEPVGFVTYTIDFAIWVASDVLRIDDLYLETAYRGQGLGRRLMREIARRALAGGMQVRWEVMPRNRNAQAFYHGLGAELRDKVIARWDSPAMAALLDTNSGEDT
jgi:ribosomal protein S18 acetylase RimI-like enzyme